VVPSQPKAFIDRQAHRPVRTAGMQYVRFRGLGASGTIKSRNDAVIWAHATDDAVHRHPGFQARPLWVLAAKCLVTGGVARHLLTKIPLAAAGDAWRGASPRCIVARVAPQLAFRVVNALRPLPAPT
jgi:hypothetical protein